MPVEQQQVEVSDEATGVDTSADNNAGAMVIKGKDLDALSDDPDELQNELNALAGPSAGPNGGQIYIDGFTGGQLPPKSSIREIRINQNPFSAQYDKLGYGRIEILTKPGTDKFHGMFMINGNDSAFNSLNPFVTSEPPYYSTFLDGQCRRRAEQERLLVRQRFPPRQPIELDRECGAARLQRQYLQLHRGCRQSAVAPGREPALRFSAGRQQHAHRPLHV